ncbi:hypothetical protein [Sebaldella termitidis]|uniref:hypothetical protein n=1 Tax=Sebaldella termitidis TaxID=826 RepID=UPI003EB99AB8
MEELQKNTNYELKIKESGTGINKKYEIVINKDGGEYKKTQNLENEFDNLIAQHNNSINQVGNYKFQLSGLQQFNEGGNRVISLDN